MTAYIYCVQGLGIMEDFLMRELDGFGLNGYRLLVDCKPSRTLKLSLIH